MFLYNVVAVHIDNPVAYATQTYLDTLANDVSIRHDNGQRRYQFANEVDLNLLMKTRSHLHDNLL